MPEASVNVQNLNQIILGDYFDWSILPSLRFDTSIFCRRRPLPIDDITSIDLVELNYSPDSIIALHDASKLAMKMLGIQGIVGMRLLGSSVSGTAGTFPYNSAISIQDNTSSVTLNRIQRDNKFDVDIELLIDETEISAKELAQVLKQFRDDNFVTPISSISVAMFSLRKIENLFDNYHLAAYLFTEGIRDENHSFVLEPYLRFLAIHNSVNYFGNHIYQNLYNSLRSQLKLFPDLDKLLRQSLASYLTYNNYKILIKRGDIETITMSIEDSRRIVAMRKAPIAKDVGIIEKIKI